MSLHRPVARAGTLTAPELWESAEPATAEHPVARELGLETADLSMFRQRGNEFLFGLADATTTSANSPPLAAIAIGPGGTERIIGSGPARRTLGADLFDREKPGSPLRLTSSAVRGLALHRAHRAAVVVAVGIEEVADLVRARMPNANVTIEDSGAIIPEAVPEAASQNGKSEPEEEPGPGAEPEPAEEPEESEPEAEAGDPTAVGPGQDAAGSRTDWRTKLAEAIEEMNSKYFVADMQGAAVIASSESDPMLGRERLLFSRPQDIRLLYANRYVVAEVKDSGEEVRKPLGNVWLSHPDRRTYDRIALIPRGKVPEGTYNLWRGFGVTAKKGDWSTIREHLRDVVCAGDDAHFEWLLHWIARCVQFPELRAEVAVVLRGPKGTGKGAAARILLSLFRHHSLSISNSRHLVGNFNAHLVDVLFLFLDEAFWAGDKAGEGTLKSLITEPTILVEPKGINAFMVPNRLKIFMASNADWVVPATADERRYFVLDISDARRGDPAYFTRLFEAIKGDELPALLYDLLRMDISDFNHRQTPHTSALNRQKLIGGDALTRFWLDCLVHGEIPVPRSSLGDQDQDGKELVEGWPKDIPTQLLHEAYVDHAHKHGDRHPATDAEMGRRLREMVPELQTGRPRRRFRDRAKPTRYMLPDLQTCRNGFLEHMNIEQFEWHAPEDAEETGSMFDEADR